MKRFIISLGLVAFLAACDSSPEVAKSNGDAPSPSTTSNDSFFDADVLNEDTQVSATLSADNTQDYYVINVPSKYNGGAIVTLTGLGGDADIEMFDFNLNLISWSRTADDSNEAITIWHSAAYDDESYQVGTYYLKVYAEQDSGVAYTIEYDFDRGNAL